MDGASFDFDQIKEALDERLGSNNFRLFFAVKAAVAKPWTCSVTFLRVEDPKTTQGGTFKRKKFTKIDAIIEQRIPIRNILGDNG